MTTIVELYRFEACDKMSQSITWQRQRLYHVLQSLWWQS